MLLIVQLFNQYLTLLNLGCLSFIKILHSNTIPSSCSWQHWSRKKFLGTKPKHSVFYLGPELSSNGVFASRILHLAVNCDEELFNIVK